MVNVNNRKVYRTCILGVLLAVNSAIFLFISLSIQKYINFLKVLVFLSASVCAADVLAGIVCKRFFLTDGVLKNLIKINVALAAVVYLPLIALILLSLSFPGPDSFSLNTSFFCNKEVMVIVPHQDDEINLAGGVIEQYVNHGSSVSIVFSTNGDYNDLAEIRFSEAVEAASAMGVDRNHVYFLGFGDTWNPQYDSNGQVGHIYNAADTGATWTSHNGKDHTYGTPSGECYLSCTYTRDNYLNSLKSIITQLSPDVIYCVDYDSHVDHRALDLLFEEALGKILAEIPDYTPVVYKGFCYSTAWYGPEDFFDSANLGSTKEPSRETWSQSGGIYIWGERVRIPIGAENLNPMLSNTSVYSALESHKSANAYLHTEGVLNGDKVFWERKTGSLLYNAEFYSDGKQINLWNDFKIKDSFDICEKAAPSDGIMLADQIDVVLPQATTINQIYLYDHPDQGYTVSSGSIRFDNGYEVVFDGENRQGGVISIAFPDQKISQMRIALSAAEGGKPGLSEIEAYYYGENSTAEDRFVMLKDEQDNFVYDYRIEEGERAIFSLYAYPTEQGLNLSSAEIKMDADEECSYEIYADKLIIICPEGKSAKITVSFEDGVGNTISVSNPGRWNAYYIHLLQKVNRHFAYTCASLRSFALELKIRYFL